MVDGWMSRLTDKRMEDNFHPFWSRTPLTPGRLTVDPQAILQLCVTCHIGCHAAVAPSIRQLGSLNEEDSAIG